MRGPCLVSWFVERSPGRHERIPASQGASSCRLHSYNNSRVNASSRPKELRQRKAKQMESQCRVCRSCSEPLYGRGGDCVDTRGSRIAGPDSGRSIGRVDRMGNDSAGRRQRYLLWLFSHPVRSMNPERRCEVMCLRAGRCSGQRTRCCRHKRRLAMPGAGKMSAAQQIRLVSRRSCTVIHQCHDSGMKQIFERWSKTRTLSS